MKMKKRYLIMLISFFGMIMQGQGQTFAGKTIDNVFPKVIKVISVKVNNANLRKGPDTSFPIQGKVMRDVVMPVFDMNELWYKVKNEYYDSFLYINRTLCKDVNVGTIPADKDMYYYESPYTGETTFLRIKGDLNLVICHSSSDMGGEQIDLGVYHNGFYVFYYNMVSYNINWKNLSESELEKMFYTTIREGMNKIYVVTAQDINRIIRRL